MRRVKASQKLGCPDGEVVGYYLSWCRGFVSGAGMACECHRPPEDSYAGTAWMINDVRI